MRPTLKTIAQALNLSVTAVSRALKDADDIGVETRARVRETAERLGYRPDPRGVNLRTGKTNNVCMVIPIPDEDGLGDIGAVNLIAGVSVVLRRNGLSLMVVPQAPDEDDLTPIRHVVEAQLADAVIFQRTRPQDPRVGYLIEKKLPFVLFGRTEMFSPHAFVDVDHETVVYRSAKRLFEGGHRVVALINPPEDLTYASHRLSGYRRALGEAGLAFNPDLVVWGDLEGEMDLIATRRLAALPEPPTGFISPTELTTVALINGLRESGRVIGRDASIISFDSTPLTRYQWPRVTAFYASMTEIGRELGEFAVRVISGEDPSSLREIIEAELIEQPMDRLGG